MLKLEVIHKENALTLIEDECRAHGITGFTTMEVHAGFGPMMGEYHDDPTDTQYYTVIIMPDEKAEPFIRWFRSAVGSNQVFMFTSPVTLVNGAH